MLATPLAKSLGFLVLALTVLLPRTVVEQTDTASIVGTVKDGSGAVMPGVTVTATQAGTDVALTLDQNVQWAAEYALLDQVRATRAKGGMAALVDVTNGDVLAMASVHGGTATEPARVAQSGDRNAPLTDLFEPGSTTKLVTLAWAIEHGKVTPETSFNVPWAIRVDPSVKPYFDAEWHGPRQMTTSEILQRSSNVGTIQTCRSEGELPV